MKRKIKNAILKSLSVISLFIVLLGACSVDCGLTWKSVAVITACITYIAIFCYANRHNKMFSCQDVICDWDA